MNGIAFLDVDHTLTRRSSGARFLTEATRRGIVPARFVVALAWYTLAYRLGMVSFTARPAELRQLRGQKRATLESIARGSFERRLRGDIFPGAAALVAQLHAAGDAVVIASSSLDFIVQPLADHLGVDGVIATRLEFEDGTCTGRFDGAPLFRGEKLRAVMAWLEERGTAPAACAFYSDSVYDLPLLEAVGRPAAVNPDWRLRRQARARGWPVIDLS